MIDRARLREVFAAASAETDPARRATALDALCGDDGELRREVESLLAHDASPAVDLERGAVVLAAERDAALPERIDRYRILGLLGEGGMGVVYLAEEPAPHRLVALKVLRSTLATPARRARFEREVAALARLQHPGIVPIHAAGTDAEGQPWFAMEHVRGRPLVAWARETGAGRRDRLRAIARIGAAIRHAHERGVIHRDLKPSNILVGDDDQPRVLDFGVARLLDDDGDRAGATRSGEVLGTPAYMSPEQIAGRASDHGAAIDVHALGVLTFELLSGRLPYDVGGASLAEAARIIRDEAPATLTTILRDARGDLETIVGKALEKDPARRYRSVAAFVDDLERHLDGRPILARPPSVAYQLRKLAGRHRALFAGAALAAASLLVATAVSIGFAWREAEARAAEAEQASAARRQAYLANVAAMESALQVPDVVAARRRLDALPPAGARPFEAAHHAAQLDGAVRTLDVPRRAAVEASPRGRAADVVYALAWSPDGRTLAAGASDGRVLAWSIAPSPTAVVAPPPPPLGRDAGHAVLGAAFAPDGRTFVVVTSGATAVAWNTEDWTERWRVAESDWGGAAAAPGADVGFGCVAWSPDGATIALGSASGTVHLVDPRDGTRIDAISAGDAVLWDVVFAGADLVVADAAGMVTILSRAERTVRAVLEAHAPGTTSVALAPDGATIATGGADGLVRVWRRADLHLERTLVGHAERASSVSFTPDGTAILSTSSDQTARLWSLADGRAAPPLLGHVDLVDCGAIAPDGVLAATGSNDGTVRLWHLPTVRAATTVAVHAAKALAVAESRDGLLVSADVAGRVRFADGPTGLAIGEIAMAPPVRALAFDPAGARCAIGCGDGTIEVIDAATGATTAACVGHAGDIAAVLLLDDGALSTGFDGALRAWDRAGSPRWSVAAHEGRALALDLSPDGRTVVTGGFDGKVRLWSRADGAAIATIDAHGWVVSGAAFLDDDAIATAGFDGSLRTWSRRGATLRPPIEFGQPVIGMVRDGPRSRVALSFTAPRIAVLDAAHGDLVATLRALDTVPTRIAWRDDGAAILATERTRVASIDATPLGAKADARQAAASAAEPGRARAAAAIERAGGDLRRARAIVDADAALAPTVRRAAQHAILAEGLARRGRSG